MNSPPSPTTLQPSTVEELAQALKQATDNHRQIVPIVGAGLSADCGFPVIAAVERYIGKLYRYIELHGPLTQRVNRKLPFLKERFDGYKKEPWRFVEDFGWPDRFQLNHDLFTKLDSRKSTGEHLIKDAVKEGHKKFEKIQSSSSGLKVGGDWRRLILGFTNYQSDYADALFARFGVTRQPGQGHKFLTFLVKHLAVPTIFTLNFDSLIEQALESEGIRPRVFAMERGVGLPHAGLVHDLSIIKMHGSTHALLLDEELDRPLSEEYLRRFDGLIRSNPILLVVGCSDRDRRLRDLVKHVAIESFKLKRSQASRTSSEARNTPDGPSVLWLHYGKQSPKFLDELSAELRTREILVSSTNNPGATREILVSPTNNPGATLMHLHSWLTSCNPAGRVPYLAHVERPIHLGMSEPGTKKDETNIELTNSQSKGPSKECIRAPAGNLENTASNELLKRANYWAREDGSHFIWIDFEAVHTLAGVVGSIIDQCRKIDPDLAPSVLPVEIGRTKIGRPGNQALTASAIRLAAKRVARALKRTRYYLAFDGLETYVWPATTHHGLTHMAINNGARVRLKKLVDFLKHLKDERVGESKIGISVDGSISRYSVTGSKQNLSKYLALNDQVDGLDPKDLKRELNKFNLEKEFKELAQALPLVSLKVPKKIRRILTGNKRRNPGNVEGRARLALVLFNLSCFRRTRPLVAMRHLLDPLLRGQGDNGRHDVADSFLRQFSGQSQGNRKQFTFLQQLEGGGYWFNHKIRDEVYARNTRYTNTDHLQRCLKNPANKNLTKKRSEERAKHWRNATFQLFLTAMTHRRVARTWYTTFMQSQDTFAFLEYSYHRISSIRSLAKLRALAQVALQVEGKGIAKAILTGIAKCGKLVRLIDPRKPPIAALEFEDEGPFYTLLREGVASRPTAQDTQKTIKELEGVLRKRHVGEISTLHRAWIRAEVTLRTQLPAEQLLHWCDELLEDDLVHRCNRVVINYQLQDRNPKTPKFHLKYHEFQRDDENQNAELIDSDLETNEIARFREYLRDLQVKLCIERSDYETCIETRGELLKKKEIQTKHRYETKVDVDKEAAFDVVKCHQQLDIVDCRIKSAQELSFDDEELGTRRKKAAQDLESVKEELDKVEKQLNDESNNSGKNRELQAAHRSNQSNLNEARLRWFHLNAECQLGRVSVFSHDGFTGNPNQWSSNVANLDGARATIEDGLRLIRSSDTRIQQAPRSVVIDPTADGSLYLQYRSVFHLLHGRVEWLTQPQNPDETFEKAFRFFERARGGDKSPLMSALIELYAVEALLGRARGKLFDETKPAWDLAAGMYDSAGGGLRRAREFLLASRRNAIWQKLYFRLATQYHSDRLLLDYARMERIVAEVRRKKSDEPAVAHQGPKEVQRALQKMSGKFLVRLRTGYGTLLTALALYLPKSSTPAGEHKNRFRWLNRMWWELTLCGYATGRLVIHFSDERINDERTKDQKDEQADSFVISQLKWLNKTGGLEDSELDVKVKDHSEYFDKHYRALGRIRKEPVEQALLRRRRLMMQAMRKADEP